MKKEKLLEEIFDSAEADDLRRASLEAGLGAMQRKRRRRMAVRGVATICAAGLMAAGLHFLERNEAEQHVSSITNAARPDLEIINADQLIAMFPNRPVALIGPEGKQKLVFLDETSEPGHPEN